MSTTVLGGRPECHLPESVALVRAAVSPRPGAPFVLEPDSRGAEPESGWARGCIGVFDSGLGGLTVVRELIRMLPNERICYAADTANFPYGPLSLEEVRNNSLAVMDELVAAGVKLLVIGCNTASAACLHDARERYRIPVVGVVVPAGRRALDVTRNGMIGVVATEGTVRSKIYEDVLGCVAGSTVVSVACPVFAEFAERGMSSGREVSEAAAEYLSPLRSAGVDTVVLGCTHYELLEDVIRAALGPSVTLVSCSEETALDVQGILAESGQLNLEGVAEGAWHEIRSTRPDAVFKARLRFLLESEWWASGTVQAGPVTPEAAPAGR
jgi:glutamate racemase